MNKTRNIFDLLGLVSVAADHREDSVPALIQSNEATGARLQMQYLEERLEKLTLINMAMWSLIRQHTQLSEEELMERVKEIDLLDGKPDGKVSRQVARCGKCQRVMSPRHSKCLYCGEPKLTLTAFDTVL